MILHGVLEVDYFTYIALGGKLSDTENRVVDILDNKYTDSADIENPSLEDLDFTIEDLSYTFDIAMIEYFTCRYLESILLSNKTASQVQDYGNGVVYVEAKGLKCPVKIYYDADEYKKEFEKIDALHTHVTDQIIIYINLQNIKNNIIPILASLLEKERESNKRPPEELIREYIIRLLLQYNFAKNSIIVAFSKKTESVSNKIMSNKNTKTKHTKRRY